MMAHVYVPSAQYDSHSGVWHMGEPDRKVRHFNSAASKARYYRIKKFLEAEDPVDEEAIQEAYKANTHQVPVYRGYDQATMKYYMRQAKRMQRKAREIAAQGVVVNEDELER